jgi:hypothetical protein
MAVSGFAGVGKRPPVVFRTVHLAAWAACTTGMDAGLTGIVVISVGMFTFSP